MPIFTVLSRVDAYFDYTAEVEADDAQHAADLAYDGDVALVWQPAGTQEFDARRVVALDADGEEIESTTRGKG